MSGKGNGVRVGKVRLSGKEALDYVATYVGVGADPKAPKPFAFPAYDTLDVGSGPTELNDGDLLAPAMLNVSITIRAFYGLQAVRPQLTQALSDESLAEPLEAATDATIDRVIPPIYSILDQDDLRPQDISGTKLSKIVHRKRPEFLVLHDRWVRECYVGQDAPLPKARNRTWADYMVLLHKAIRDDINRSRDTLIDIRSSTPAAESLSLVRVMDILAWSSRGGELAVSDD